MKYRNMLVIAGAVLAITACQTIAPPGKLTPEEIARQQNLLDLAGDPRGVPQRYRQVDVGDLSITTTTSNTADDTMNGRVQVRGVGYLLNR